MAWSKESSTKRGYDYAWQKKRLRILDRDNHLCQPCLKKGRVTEGNEVDHIINKASADKHPHIDIESDDNLQAICTECHENKSAEEKGHKVKRQIGVDGWPV